RAEGHEQVLDVPHDALGHAGGAAGVDDVDVLAGARPEVPFGAGGAECVPVRDGAGDAGRPVDGDEVLQLGRLAVHGGHPRLELGVVHQHPDVGVPVEVEQLVLHVPVVDVDRDGAELERGQQPGDVLDAVAQV